MVKKTIIAIGVVVLLAAVFVGAAQKWGYTRYGTFYYYGDPPFSYSSTYVYPFGSYHPYQYYKEYGYPLYAYPYDYKYGPSYPEYGYPYGRQPVLSYPSYSTPNVPRGKAGQLCGVIESQAYGCEFGLECDYTKTGVAGVGMCTRQPPVTTYPYQVGPSTTYPYYYTY
jgi:hypothetical protein